MATIVFYNCNKCKKSLGSQDVFYSIGIPFIVCQNCGEANVISKFRTEWILKTPFKRFASYVDALALGPIVGGLLAFVFVLAIKKFIGISHPLIGLVIFAPVVFFISKSSISRINKEIHESNERMNDEKYREILKNLGLLK